MLCWGIEVSEKRHGIIGKGNVEKQGEKKQSDIHIRMEIRLKAGAVKSAQKCGQMLFQWSISLVGQSKFQIFNYCSL
jgi:hypothetical protein